MKKSMTKALPKISILLFRNCFLMGENQEVPKNVSRLFGDVMKTCQIEDFTEDQIVDEAWRFAKPQTVKKCFVRKPAEGKVWKLAKQDNRLDKNVVEK